jgi:type I restriction enzyme S subunit
MSWPSIPLRELCSPKQHPTISAAELTTEGYPAFGANGQIGFYKEFTHAVTTIAITCRGATCGTVNIVPAYSYISGNAMALDKLDTKRVDLRFLAYTLRFRGLSDVISGSAQPQITRGPLLAVQIPLPPLPEQRRIAAILDCADTIRRKRRLALKHLDGLHKAIFTEMFGDPFANSKLLPTQTLGDLIKVRSGDALIGANQNGGAFPVYGGNGINGWHDSYIVPSSTIVIGRVGVYCGAVHVTDREAWVTDNALIVQIKSRYLLTPYLAAALKYADLNQYAGKAAQPLVSGSRIYPVAILMPPIDDQRVFGERVAAAERVHSSFRAHFAKLDVLFASLQHRAFNGELTSMDAERELAQTG